MKVVYAVCLVPFIAKLTFSQGILKEISEKGFLLIMTQYKFQFTLTQLLIFVHMIVLKQFVARNLICIQFIVT